MTLAVETGTASPTTEAYASVVIVADYAAKRGLPWSPSSETAAEIAIRNATTWLDAYYRERFLGYRLRGRNQALEWPRTGATVAGFPGETIASNIVPQEVVAATCEAAVIELNRPGSLAPDIRPGSEVTSLSAGSVSISFGGAGRSNETLSRRVGQVLKPVLHRASSLGGRLERI